MRFQMTAAECKNFCTIRSVMKTYGYFYSGHRVEEDEVKLIFQKYGTDNDQLIAYSYGKLKEVTKENKFAGWFSRAINNLFNEEEKKDAGEAPVHN
jgi:hypothetical protein